MAIVAGLVVARIAYIVFHWEAYAVDPLTTLAFWQGGFTAWAGLLAAAAILAWRMRPMRAMHKALGALAAVAAIWFAARALLQPDARPLPALPDFVRLTGHEHTPHHPPAKPFKT